MAKLKSFLYLLIIFLTISSLSYGEENPKKWYTGIIQPTALELQQAGDSLHIQILYNFDNIQDLKDTLLSEGRTGLTDFTVASDDDDEDL